MASSLHSHSALSASSSGNTGDNTPTSVATPPRAPPVGFPTFGQQFTTCLGQFSAASYGILLCYCLASRRLPESFWEELLVPWWPHFGCRPLSLITASAALSETAASVLLHNAVFMTRLHPRLLRHCLHGWGDLQVELLLSATSLLGWTWMVSVSLMPVLIADNGIGDDISGEGASGWEWGAPSYRCNPSWFKDENLVMILSVVQLCRIFLSESTLPAKLILLDDKIACIDCGERLTSLSDSAIIVILQAKGLLREAIRGRSRSSRSGIETRGDHDAPAACSWRVCPETDDVEEAASSPECAGIYLYLMARRMQFKQLAWYDAVGTVRALLEFRQQLASRITRAAGRRCYTIDRGFAQQLMSDIRQCSHVVIFDVLLGVVYHQPLSTIVTLFALVGTATLTALQPLAIGYLTGMVCSLSGRAALVDYVVLAIPFAIIHFGTALLEALATLSIARVTSLLVRHTPEELPMQPRQKMLMRLLVTDLLPIGVLKPAVHICASLVLLFAMSKDVVGICLVSVVITYRIHRADAGQPKLGTTCDSKNASETDECMENWTTEVGACRRNLGPSRGKIAAAYFQTLVLLVSVVPIWLLNDPSTDVFAQYAVGAQVVTLCLVFKTVFEASEQLSISVQRICAVKCRL